MDTIKLLILFILTTSCQSKHLPIKQYIAKLNADYGFFRATSAEILWKVTVNTTLTIDNPQVFRDEGKLEQIACNYLTMLFDHECFNDYKRMNYLFCRGPKYEVEEWKKISKYYKEMEAADANSEVCIPSDGNVSIHDYQKAEATIMEYLSDVERVLGTENKDLVLYAAKLAVSNSVKDKEKKMCLKGHHIFKDFMRYSTNEPVLKWLWLTWREKISRAKEAFFEFSKTLNAAAKRSGYKDQGAIWREELEMPDVRIIIHMLYSQTKELLMLIHGVLRFHLREIYGDIVPEKGPIPAHLVGSFGNNWDVWVDRLLPRNIKIEEEIKKKNWTTMELTTLVEDMYYSMGLYPMTEQFWKNSIFERGNHTNMDCHGAALDMYKTGDYRILYCAGNSYDFQVLHHEMGHIQYFMHYAHQPTIYKSANSFFHESIGEAVILGALTPQHLNRLGIITDAQLYGKMEDTDETTTETIPNTVSTTIETTDTTPTADVTETTDIYDKTNTYTDEAISTTVTVNNVDENKNVDEDTEKVVNNNNGDKKTKDKIIDSGPKQYTKLFDGEDLTIDLILLTQSAFKSLPGLAFNYVLDVYRWFYYEDSILSINGDFWDVMSSLLGIEPPLERGEEYMDAMAIYYFNHNIPTSRYFLGTFLQHQLFEKMCIASVYGDPACKIQLPETMQMTRCDIYGSKAAGKVLAKIMEPGNSQHWKTILRSATGEEKLTAAAFNRYYEPLRQLLKKHVSKHNIPIGW